MKKRGKGGGEKGEVRGNREERETTNGRKRRGREEQESRGKENEREDIGGREDS